MSTKYTQSPLEIEKNFRRVSLDPENPSLVFIRMRGAGLKWTELPHVMLACRINPDSTPSATNALLVWKPPIEFRVNGENEFGSVARVIPYAKVEYLRHTIHAVRESRLPEGLELV